MNSGCSTTRSGRELLVIGYGNTLRGDDAVGQRVAEVIENLKLPGVRTLSCALLTPELAAAIARATRVVFVDATTEVMSEVAIRRLLPANSSQVFAHSTEPATLLAMARDLFEQVPEAWCLAIPVESLKLGEELSALAKRGMQVAVEKIQRMSQ